MASLQLQLATISQILHQSVMQNHSWLIKTLTKDSLTLYLADVVLLLQRPIVSVSRVSVQSNSVHIQSRTGVSTQEEADTLMILHAKEISDTGQNVHILTQDTDVLVLAI